MRIVCPNCAAAYDVPDAMLASGTRKVRCARCGTEWAAGGGMTTAPLPPDDLDPALAPPPKPPADPHGRAEPRLNPLRPRAEPRFVVPDEPPEPPPPERGGGLALAAWVLSLLLLAGACAAAVQWRAQVMTAWPPSERVFAALGLR